MRSYFRKIVLLFALPILVGCSGLYPIKHRLKSTDIQTSDGYNMTIDPADFYQLRVTETVDFIPVNTENDSRTLVSDLPYRYFQQDTTQQDSIYRGGPLTIEEVYMYLDGIHSKNENGSDSQYGYILYFITYAAVDGNIVKAERRNASKVRKYFNDPDKLYINTVRDIYVGYWVKNSSDGVLLFFKLGNGTINVHRARLHSDRIGIIEVAHPNKNNWRIDSYDVLRKMIDFDGLSRNDQNRTEAVNSEKLDILFDKIYESVSLIKLDNVFDLNQKNELQFINIPKGKEFVFEKRLKSNTSEFYTIDQFILKDPQLLIKAKKGNRESLFEFKPKHIQFRTPD